MKAKPKATAAIRLMVFLPAALLAALCVGYWDAITRVAIGMAVLASYAIILLMAAMGLIH